jgi:hypothetical protein
MRHPDIFVSILVLSLFLPVGARAARDTEAVRQDAGEEVRDIETRRVIKTVDGLNFNVEEDRPIVKQDGVYQPLGIDSYVALKIERLRKEMQARITALEERIALLEASLKTLQQETTALPSGTNDAS